MEVHGSQYRQPVDEATTELQGDDGPVQEKQQSQQKDNCDLVQDHAASAEVEDDKHKSEITQLLIEKHQAEQILLLDENKSKQVLIPSDSTSSPSDAHRSPDIQTLLDDILHQQADEKDYKGKMPGPDGQLINVSIVDCTNQLELKSYSGEEVDIAALVASKVAKLAGRDVATKKAAKEAAA